MAILDTGHFIGYRLPFEFHWNLWKTCEIMSVFKRWCGIHVYSYHGNFNRPQKYWFSPLWLNQESVKPLKVKWSFARVITSPPALLSLCTYTPQGSETFTYSVFLWQLSEPKLSASHLDGSKNLTDLSAFTLPTCQIRFQFHKQNGF